MDPRSLLRVEGLAVLGISLGSYLSLDGSLVMLAVLALAPDLSMLGYLAGPRIGSVIYNIVHTYTLPISLGVLGFVSGIDLALLLALIWTAHIGADRLVGYGLKHASGFSDTHLSSPPVPGASDDSEG